MKNTAALALVLFAFAVTGLVYGPIALPSPGPVPVPGCYDVGGVTVCCWIDPATGELICACPIEGCGGN